MPAKSQQRHHSDDEVLEWIERYQQDDQNEEVQMLLINRYSDLVEALARKYSRGRAIHDDLVQVGMIGLLAALRRFDPEFGRSFESFAVPTIIGEIKRFIRDKTWSVHVPRRIKELGPKIKKTVEELTTELQRSPRIDEIADHLGVSDEEILETLEMGKSYQALSVDSSIEADNEGSTVTLLDLVGSQERGYESVDQRLILQKAFGVLNEREQAILECAYYKNMSQKETGELLGISQMHVSRLQRRALEKLREAIKVPLNEVFSNDD